MMPAPSREPSCSQAPAWLAHELRAHIHEAGQLHISSLTIARDELILRQVSKNYVG